MSQVVVNPYRYVAQIVSGDSLRAYWRFNETSGTTATNTASSIAGNSSVGSGANLALTNVTLGDTTTPSNLATGAEFDGSSIGETGSGTESLFNFLHDGSDWSCAFWAKMASVSSNQHIIDNKGAAGEDVCGLDIRTRTTAKWYVVGTKCPTGYYVTRAATDSYITADQWEFFVMTWDNSATEVAFWRDGGNEVTGSGTTGVSGSDAENTLVVGGYGTTATLDSIICELSLWSRKLTDQNIVDLYGSGGGLVLT